MITKHNIPEYGVTEFNKLVRDILESNYSYVKIRGEISEIKFATKGQLYIIIKDQDSNEQDNTYNEKLYSEIKIEKMLEALEKGNLLIDLSSSKPKSENEKLVGNL